MTLALPLPSDLSEVARVEHTRLRRRLLNGEAFPDFQRQLYKNLGEVRSKAVGDPDDSLNPFDDNCAAASALYDLHPRVSHADGASLAAMLRLVDDALLYPMMSRVQKDVLGTREELLRCDVQLQWGRAVASYRRAYADLVELEADPRAPAQPISVTEYVERKAPGRDERIWTREVWDLKGVPRHQVLTQDGKTDLSQHYGLPAGGAVGEQYPAFRSDGRPILPYVLFHASATGHLLDPFYRRELVIGTLNVVVLWTFFGHCVRRASWPQRWILGGTIAGSVGKDGRSDAVADPASVVEILKDPTFDGQVQAGQWGSASDPKSVAEAIGIYQERFNGYHGIELRRNNSDPRSGLAIVADSSAKRAAQRKFAPVFRPPDIAVLSTTAVLANRVLGAPIFREDGWDLEHVGLPPSPEERDAERAEVLELRSAKLISRIEARMRLMGETEAEAQKALALVDAEQQPAMPA